MSIRAADAMALAVIYSTYLQLVFEEEGERVPVDILEKFEKNDHEAFMWAPPKDTLHLANQAVSHLALSILGLVPNLRGCVT